LASASVRRGYHSYLFPAYEGEEAFKTFGVLILNHRSAHCHHERDGSVSLTSSRLLKQALHNRFSPLCRFDFRFPGRFSAIFPVLQSR
jgi:hypothetical protein